MNTLLLIILGFPILEIALMIKVGEQIGAINTVLLVFLTAIIGIHFARIEGVNTIRSGFTSLYKNKAPIYEIISGASIAFAAALLIVPGFISDTAGFILLFPFTRKIIIHFWLKKKYKETKKNKNDILDGEIIENHEKDKNEL